LVLLFAQMSHGQWLPQAVPNELGLLLSVDFIDSNVGAASGSGIGGHAIYTTNGGVTWTLAQVPDSTRFLGALQFTDALTGYSAGSFGLTWDFQGLFARTTNAGQSWHRYGTLPDSVFVLLGISFVNSQIGFVTADEAVAYGSAKILKTTNGGLNWTRLTIPDSLFSLLSITFIDSLRGFAAGSRYYTQRRVGVILETIDGGLTWSEHVFPTAAGLKDIHFPSQSTGYAVGPDTSIYRSIVYKTTNGGSDWFLLAVTPDTILLEGVRFAGNSATGIVYGHKASSDTLYTVPLVGRTTNGGADWSYEALSGFPPRSTVISGKLITDSIGYICGGSGGQAFMLHTTNGGTTFVPPQPNGTLKQYYLAQNYPNPFNPSTTIRFELPQSTTVRLILYNALGQLIATLVDQERQAGRHEVVWDGRNSLGQSVAGGIYFCRIQAGVFEQTRKLALVR